MTRAIFREQCFWKEIAGHIEKRQVFIENRRHN